MNISHHHLTGKRRHYSYILLVIWAFALLSHTAHGEILSQLYDETTCHVCQNTLDNNVDIDVDIIQHQPIIRLHVLVNKSSILQSAKFFRPNLRAPPVKNTL